MKDLVPVVFVALTLSACTGFPSPGGPVDRMRVPGTARPLIPGDILSTATGSVVTFHQMVEALERVPVIYVGETHIRGEDHDLQLRIIERLHLQGRQLLIGMEMFQRRHQEALDDFVAGRIDEQGLQRVVDWPRSWGYDFRLYALILRYAREEGIPILALNARSELVRKVARVGLAGLEGQERAEIPSPWPQPNAAYREFLRGQFETHAHGNLPAFDRFMEAQLLWDATMAQTLADRMGQGTVPSARCSVVLAGRGHVGRGTGIPLALEDRLPLPYLVVMPVEEGELRGLDLSWTDFLVPIFTPDERHDETQRDRSGY